MRDPIKQANGCDFLAGMFKHMAKLLRGEDVDLTGVGHLRILYDNIERVMGVRVITEGQYHAFALQDAARRPLPDNLSPKQLADHLFREFLQAAAGSLPEEDRGEFWDRIEDIVARQ